MVMVKKAVHGLLVFCSSFSATSGLCAASKKLRLHEHELRTWIKRMNMPENAWNDDRHFLRTPLESAFAFQWEDAKWPPQSEESYILFVNVCCVIPFDCTQLSGNGCVVLAMWTFFWKCSWLLSCFDVWWSWWRKLCNNFALFMRSFGGFFLGYSTMYTLLQQKPRHPQSISI